MEFKPLHSFYHSFFAIDPAEKGKGYGKKLAQATVENLRGKIDRKGLIYCHVEEDNLRSLRIAESLGYEHVGNFSAMTFSRFFPESVSSPDETGARGRSAMPYHKN